MGCALAYFDEVLEDVRQAKDWYKNQKVDLDREFSKAIEDCLDRILQTPEIYPLRYRQIRIAHPRRFPYNIHFYVDKPSLTVVITAIVHSKRHPFFAEKRKG